MKKSIDTCFLTTLAHKGALEMAESLKQMAACELGVPIGILVRSGALSRPQAYIDLALGPKHFGTVDVEFRLYNNIASGHPITV